MIDLEAIGPGLRGTEVMNVVVEVPKVGSNKCEYDAPVGAFVVDRVHFSPLFYPCEYGFVSLSRTPFMRRGAPMPPARNR